MGKKLADIPGGTSMYPGGCSLSANKIQNSIVVGLKNSCPINDCPTQFNPSLYPTGGGGYTTFNDVTVCARPVVCDENAGGKCAPFVQTDWIGSVEKVPDPWEN